mmetsp:Transcript_26258/g.63275  ORF Transcript_26258/g.63275 Transcript_26258/m.63275 type:complete len:361 (-) Transcript_26258:274-1356(-)|eukprot:CAMPEP_0114529668 /NCGR_PEP_ID=MMETSP0109-20121206/24986_1 /TAXON_ID=29199 /ORGANISM="Chlorarachnion reptans, Strain CCCM449" /LENGTH=360 /DNA_ID=CAMNT_0001712143 /DNA_START=249 /DNA_END=1331 /DNA_ORIENTATION=+
MTDIIPLILSVMLVFVGFGLGATIRYQDVISCLKEKRIATATGCLTQYGLMPLIAYFYANVFKLKTEHAIGLMLTASAPGGVTTNLITYWSNGDVMLSITMSAVSTTLAFGMMPLLIEIYINSTFTDGGDLEIPYPWIVITLLLLIVPCAVGICIRSKSEVWAKRAEKLGSVLGVIFLFGALIYALATDVEFLDQSFGLWWSCATLQIIGCFFAYGIAYCAGLRAVARRTIGIEAGIQNTTLIITLVGNSFSDEDERNEVLVPVLIYSVAYFFNSVWIMFLFRYISRDETDEDIDAGKTLEDSPEEKSNGIKMIDRVSTGGALPRTSTAEATFEPKEEVKSNGKGKSSAATPVLLNHADV